MNRMITLYHVGKFVEHTHTYTNSSKYKYRDILRLHNQK